MITLAFHTCLEHLFELVWFSKTVQLRQLITLTLPSVQLVCTTRIRIRIRMRVCSMHEHLSDERNLPIVIFPEGTCINNTSVMQFKKGAFEIENATVYPVAIRVSTAKYSVHCTSITRTGARLVSIDVRKHSSSALDRPVCRRRALCLLLICLCACSE